jgi:hypothetical protein
MGLKYNIQKYKYISFSNFHEEKSSQSVVIKKLKQNLPACFLGVFLTHNIWKIRVINILFNHIELGEVTIKRSISLSLEAQFIAILFHIQTIFNHGIHLINFIYFSVFL